MRTEMRLVLKYEILIRSLLVVMHSSFLWLL